MCGACSEEVEQNLSSMRFFFGMNISGIMGDEEIEDLKEAIKEIPSFLKEAKERFLSHRKIGR